MDVIDPEKFAEENPNSRFRILNAAILAPGTCILCKSAGGDGRQFIDLGIQVDWFGAIYFCTYCIGEAATLLGFEKSDGLAKLKAVNDLIEAQQKIFELQEQLNASRVLLRNCHCGDSVPSYSDVVDVSVVEETDDSVSDSIADGDESSGIEESGDLSDSSGDDEPEIEPVKRRRRTNSSSE